MTVFSQDTDTGQYMTVITVLIRSLDMRLRLRSQ